jgi:hypothetical protein
MGKDWAGDTREALLALARTWNVKLPLYLNKTGMDPAYLQRLTDELMEAEASFRLATPENRSKVITAKMNETFGKLEKTMRYIKDHWIKMPPLTESEWVELGLDLPDTKKTPVPDPVEAAGFDIGYGGAGIIDISNIHPLGGGTVNRNRYAIIEARFGLGGDPTPERPLRFTDKNEPQSGEALPHPVLTRRSHLRLVISGEKGTVLYIAVRYLNSNLKPGPWSGVVKIIIP